MEGFSGKTVQPVKIRQVRVMQDTRGCDDNINAVMGAVGKGQLPNVRLFIEHTARHLASETDMWHHIMVCRDFLKIGFDLGTGGIEGIPFSIGGETVGVAMGRHITGQAGITVFPPGAADAVAFFINREISLPAQTELDPGQQSGHPGPDDGVTQRFVL